MNKTFEQAQESYNFLSGEFLRTIISKARKFKDKRDIIDKYYIKCATVVGEYYNNKNVSKSNYEEAKRILGLLMNKLSTDFPEAPYLYNQIGKTELALIYNTCDERENILIDLKILTKEYLEECVYKGTELLSEYETFVALESSAVERIFFKYFGEIPLKYYRGVLDRFEGITLTEEEKEILNAFVKVIDGKYNNSDINKLFNNEDSEIKNSRVLDL